MDAFNKPPVKCFSKDVTEGGKTVTVYARLIEDFGWELVIIGKNCHATTWTEWFSTSDEAMKAGLSAILFEGIDEFYTNQELAFLEGLQLEGL